MKKKICFIIMSALLLGLLSGCAEKQSEVEAKTENLIDLREPDAVDDSCSIYLESDWFEKNSITDILLRDYASKWLDGAEIIDSDIELEVLDTPYIYGWILISGIPKQPLGWQSVEYDGREAYCRWLDIRAEGEKGEYRLAKTLAMLPVKKADIKPYGDEQRLSGLKSAELYVRQLDKSFKICDDESLRKLEKGFARKSYLDYNNANRLVFSDFLNPLFLTFDDGSTALVSTSGDGSCGADLWSGFCGFYSNISLFELFGVPLEAEGYEQNPDGSTTIRTTLLEFDYTDNYKPHETAAETVFSPDGDMLRARRSFKLISPVETVYIYNDEGQLIRSESRRTEFPEKISSREFTYDEKGRLESISSLFCGELQESQKYVYDERDRVTAVIYLNQDGSEGLPSGNLHFWYDEDDNCHRFRYGFTGEICGEAPPQEGPIRRP